MLPWEKMVSLVGAIGAGVFFFASGFQTLGTNWADQTCGKLSGFCVNPEWMGAGAVSFAIAYFIFKKQN